MRIVRSWFLFFSLFAVLLLTACGGQSQPSGGDANETHQSASQDKGDSQPTQEAEQIELTVASVWPATHVQNVEIVEPFLEEIERVTEGRVTGTLYSAGALGDTTEQYDMVVTGVADVAYGLHGYTPGAFPLTGVSELPFMGNSAVDATRILNALYEKFPEFEEEHKDVKVAWLFKVDTAHILTTNKPVRRPEDLQGLKLRTPNPAANALLESFGAIPVPLPMGDTYEAMQRGVVDGALAPASVIANYQLVDVTKYITRGNFYSSSAFVVINKNTWDKISLEDQAALEELFATMSVKHAEGYDQHADEGWQLAEEAGLEIIEIPEDEMPAWLEKVESLGEAWVEEMEKMGLPGREIYDEAIRLRQ